MEQSVALDSDGFLELLRVLLPAFPTYFDDRLRLSSMWAYVETGYFWPSFQRSPRHDLRFPIALDFAGCSWGQGCTSSKRAMPAH